MQLREYQVDAIEQLRDRIRRGVRSIVLVSPTGSGKTTIAAEMIRSATAKGNGIQFLAHRKELIDQCSARLDEIGIDHSIIMGDHPRQRPWLNVHVSSVPTLARRACVPNAKLIFIDEAHRATADSYQKVMSRYPDAVFILLTATPARLDGRGLGDIAQDMVLCPSVAELTDMGYLVPARVFAPSAPDLQGVKRSGSDYKEDQLAKAVDRPKLVGSIVEHWIRLGENSQTICFAVNVEHSKHITSEFKAAGIACEHLDGKADPKERTAILKRYASGETRIVSNVQVLTEGYDNPQTRCVILGRPTMSVSLFLQMAGRGLRPYPGKSNVILLDHAAATVQHGFVDDERQWSLEGARRPIGSQRDPALSVRMCKACWCAFSSRLQACPACGKPFERQTQAVKTRDGQLTEVTRPQRSLYEPKKISANPVMAYYQEQARERGADHRWAWGMKTRFEARGDKQQLVPPDVYAAWCVYRHLKAGAA